MPEFRVLVCGGRNYGKRWDGAEWVEDKGQVNRLWKVLDKALEAATLAGRTFTLVHGGASGADSLAGLWASMRKERVTVRVYEADWKTHGRAAGPIRNKQMLDEGKPNAVIAFPGGAGTANMIQQGKRVGVPIYEVKNG